MMLVPPEQALCGLQHDDALFVGQTAPDVASDFSASPDCVAKLGAAFIQAWSDAPAAATSVSVCVTSAQEVVTATGG